MPQVRYSTQKKIHQRLGNTNVLHQQISSLSNYGLTYAAFHYAVIEDNEALWQLLNNEEYRKKQYEYAQQPQNCIAAFRFAIATQLKQPLTLQNDVRLSWLCLHASDFFREKTQDTSIAFQWFQEDASKIDEVLLRLSLLNEIGLFQASCLLLFIEAERQEKLPPNQRNIEVPTKILDNLNQKVALSVQTIDWTNLFSIDFFVFLIKKPLAVWEGLDLIEVYKRGALGSSFINGLLQDIKQADQTTLNLLAEAEKILPLFSKQAQPRVIANIAKYYDKIGKKEKASQLFEQSIIIAESLKRTYAQQLSLQDIAVHLAEMNQWSEVATILQKQPIKSKISTALVYIIKNLNNQTNYDTLLKGIEQIKNLAAQMLHQNAATITLIQIGFVVHKNHPELSQKLIEECIATTRTFENDDDKLITFARIIELLMDNQQQEMAHSIFPEVYQLTRNKNITKTNKPISKAVSKLERIKRKRNKGKFSNLIFFRALRKSHVLYFAIGFSLTKIFEHTETNIFYWLSIAFYTWMTLSYCFFLCLEMYWGWLESGLEAEDEEEDDSRITEEMILESLKQMIKNGDQQKAIDVTTSIPSIPERSKYLSVIIKHLFDTQQSQLAINLLIDNIVSSGLSTLYNQQPLLIAKIRLYMQNNREKQALALIQKLEDPSEGSFYLSLLATFVDKKGEQELAQQLFEQAIQLANTIKDFHTEKAFMHIINHLIQCNQFQNAIHLAQNYQYKPNSKKQYKNRTKKEQSQLLFTIIEALIEQQKYHEAAKICSTVPETGKKRKAWELLIDTLINEEQLNQAFQYVREIDSKRFEHQIHIRKPAVAVRSKLIAKLMVALGNKEQNEEVTELRKQLLQAALQVKSRDKALALYVVVQTQIEAHQYKEALNTIQTANDNPQLLKWKVIALAHLEKFDEAIHLTKTSDSFDVSDYFLAIVEALIEKKLFDKANQVLSLMQNDRQKVQALLKMAKAQFSQEQRSLSCLHKAVSLINNEFKHDDKTKELALVAQSLYGLLHTIPGKKLFTELIAHIETATNQYTDNNQLLQDVAITCSDNNNQKQAIEVVQKIDNTREQNSTMTHILKNYIEKKQYDEALQIITVLDDLSWKVKAICLVSHAVAKDNQKQAKKLYEKALQSILKIESDISRSFSLLEIAKSIHSSGLEQELIIPFLAKNQQSQVFFERFMNRYQKIITNQITLRKTLLIRPLQPHFMYGGLYLFIENLYEQKKPTHVQAILKQCPQLGLEALLDS